MLSTTGTDSFFDFNMIPFLNFDGEKILAWNKLVYIATVAFSAFLVFLPNIIQALES